jgi:hypothetical protein
MAVCATDKNAVEAKAVLPSAPGPLGTVWIRGVEGDASKPAIWIGCAPGRAVRSDSGGLEGTTAIKPAARAIDTAAIHARIRPSLRRENAIVTFP